jgi:hypothetical protein
LGSNLAGRNGAKFVLKLVVAAWALNVCPKIRPIPKRKLMVRSLEKIKGMLLKRVNTQNLSMKSAFQFRATSRSQR